MELLVSSSQSAGGTENARTSLKKSPLFGKTQKKEEKVGSGHKVIVSPEGNAIENEFFSFFFSPLFSFFYLRLCVILFYFFIYFFLLPVLLLMLVFPHPVGSLT